LAVATTGKALLSLSKKGLFFVVPWLTKLEQAPTPEAVSVGELGLGSSLADHSGNKLGAGNR